MPRFRCQLPLLLELLGLLMLKLLLELPIILLHLPELLLQGCNFALACCQIIGNLVVRSLQLLTASCLRSSYCPSPLEDCSQAVGLSLCCGPTLCS